MTTGIVAGLGVLVLIAAAALVKLAFDSRAMDVDLGLVDGRLTPCPASPNCVSSDAAPGDSHRVEPLADADGRVWARLIDTVGAMAGATLVASDARYLRFTFTTRWLGFVDDVEFQARPDSGEIAVRSASRVGHGDLNANRKRIESIRAALAGGSHEHR